jgi:hypothetical protein
LADVRATFENVAQAGPDELLLVDDEYVDHDFPLNEI